MLNANVDIEARRAMLRKAEISKQVYAGHLSRDPDLAVSRLYYAALQAGTAVTNEDPIWGAKDPPRHVDMHWQIAQAMAQNSKYKFNEIDNALTRLHDTRKIADYRPFPITKSRLQDVQQKYVKVVDAIVAWARNALA